MDEHRLSILPPDGNAPRATILFVPPLFEEANRMRRTLVLAMRALAREGFAAQLPDLPGQNESLTPLSGVDLVIWQEALAETARSIDGPLIIASLRGGCLIDHAARADGWWRLAPVKGASLLRTLLRARVAADREAGGESSPEMLQARGEKEALLLAGNLLSPAMLAQLGQASEQQVAPLRSLSLGANGLKGSALWLRAEPGEDRAMADAIAADIAAWGAECGVI
ncbi:hypothetical protein [Sphingopyxis sp. MWB1]|uniref:hypothetical protein n=1 Tax=Sphingopyxis sp. MWB1 TaxID=1537715 RepID=UPI00051A5C5B|nr:hypothetical protein [Sphingopyxis sp. MWB1]